MSTINISNKILKILILGLICVLVLGLLTTPALAQDGQDSNSGDSGNEIDLCSSATETANTVQNIFTIMSVLGPVFATLFFVGMSVADAATVQEKYKEQRRKVLLLGFGVPVAISFLGAIASQLLDQSVDCFFP